MKESYTLLPQINNKQKAENKKYIKIMKKKTNMSIQKGSNIRKYYPKLYNMLNKSFEDKNALNLHNDRDRLYATFNISHNKDKQNESI
jgi:hypothetical protein